MGLLERIQNDEWYSHDFTNSIYINNSTKLEVSCKTHGSFWITPNCLKSGQACAKCAGVYRRTPLDYQEELEDKFNEFEAIENFINSSTKILHKHKVCGYTWKVVPTSILSGHGCPKCTGKYKRTTIDYQKELEEASLEYEVLEEYINNRTPILHEHMPCGHIWKVRPSKVLCYQPCPKCTNYGFNPTLPATLYYISIDNGTAYKIGITNRKVSDRFPTEELERIEIIKTWDFIIGKDAYDKEQWILKEYEWAQYLGDNLLKNGNTEMFYTDVLHLDDRLRS